MCGSRPSAAQIDVGHERADAGADQRHADEVGQQTGSARRPTRRRAPRRSSTRVWSVPMRGAGEQRAEDEAEEPEHEPEDAIAGKAGQQPADDQNELRQASGKRRATCRRLYDGAVVRSPRRRPMTAVGLLTTAAAASRCSSGSATASGSREIWTGFRQIGWGLVIVVLLGGLRFARARSPGCCVSSHRTRWRSATRSARSSPAMHSATSRRSGRWSASRPRPRSSGTRAPLGAGADRAGDRKRAVHAVGRGDDRGGHGSRCCSSCSFPASFARSARWRSAPWRWCSWRRCCCCGAAGDAEPGGEPASRHRRARLDRICATRAGGLHVRQPARNSHDPARLAASWRSTRSACSKRTSRCG